jgi:hypothetical protein
MRQRYIIKGTIRMGDLVRLLLMKEDIAKPSEKIDLFEMASKAQEIMESQQTKAVLTQQPDTITISYKEWKEYEYKVDDIVWIEVKAEK